jgi:transcriptional regulator with XRE-family HTH domain
MKTSIYSSEYDALRAWLVAARLSSGLTLRELADRLAVNHSVLGKIETGGRKLDVIEFMKYCAALGVKPADGFKAVEEATARRNNKR